MHRIYILTLLLIVAFSPKNMAQDKPAYRLFSEEGKKLKYKKALKILADAEVILFGEQHNDPIAHWLELEMLADLSEQRPGEQVVVGMEMFETDQQPSLDSLVREQIDADAFEKTTGLWPNYATDYRPVVNHALKNGYGLAGTNIPRKYARMVSRQGLGVLDSLPDSEKALMMPLPIEIDYELPSYARMKEMMGGHMHGMSPANFIAAQAVKDATMADRILAFKPEGGFLWHLNGSYHSDSKEGIAWYLLRQEPSLRLANISVVTQENLDNLDEDHLGKADVIIVVPARMTKTY